jgi:hypothetical protein
MVLYTLIGKIGTHSYQRTFNVSPANYDYFTDGKSMMNSTGVKKLLADIKSKHEKKHGKMKKGEKFTCKLVSKS